MRHYDISQILVDGNDGEAGDFAGAEVPHVAVLGGPDCDGGGEH